MIKLPVTLAFTLLLSSTSAYCVDEEDITLPNVHCFDLPIKFETEFLPFEISIPEGDESFQKRYQVEMLNHFKVVVIPSIDDYLGEHGFVANADNCRRIHDECTDLINSYTAIARRIALGRDREKGATLPSSKITIFFK